MKVRCLGCMEEYEEEYGVCPICGYEPNEEPVSPLQLPPGTLLAGRYLTGRVLGYGGFGVTYLGWDQMLEQKVAVKEYLPSEFATRMVGQCDVTIFSGNKAEQFEGGLHRFVEEAKRLAQFQSEPGIVRVFDSFEENGTAYLVMEYLEGETLTALLEREGKLDPERAIALLEPVIRSLETVHATGIIHRDIAPDNIFLTKDGRVKLIDFGAARYATTSHSRSLTVIIKPGYSPEEQYRSRGEQGPWTDVYALAAVLYRIITGETPPDALERRAFYEKKRKDILIPPSKFVKLERNVENAILNALNIRAEDRTASAADFWEELTGTENVSHRQAHIPLRDVLHWPLGLKIGVPVLGVLALVFAVLLLTGRIGAVGNLVTTVTLGEGMTRVPSVVNLSLGMAQETLETQQLRSVITGRSYSDEIPVDLILTQSLAAGTVVEDGSVVELQISAASPDEIISEGRLPDVTYYQEDEAIALLNRLNVTVEKTLEYSSDAVEGVVLRQDPPMGTPVNSGDVVSLVISRGPDPNAPQLESGGEDQTGLHLNRSSLRLYVGDSVLLSASGVEDGQEQIWSSEDERIVTVHDGTVTAQSAGSTTVTVTVGDQTASCPVVVNDYTLRLSRDSLTLSASGSASLSVSGLPGGTSVSWSSSNESIASVKNGRITARGAGTVTVTASAVLHGRTYTDTCRVVVTEEEGNILLSRSSLTLLETEVYSNLTAEVSPEGTRVSWSSSDTAVVSVQNGVLTAHSAGSAVVMAEITVGNTTYSDDCQVTVLRREEKINRSSLVLVVGSKEQLRVSTNYTPDKVSVRSDNPNIASISDDGIVTGVSNGSTQIRVALEYAGTTHEVICSVTVDSKPNIFLPSSASVAVGHTLQLEAEITPAGADVSWSSENTSIARVNADGQVTGIYPGVVNITATLQVGGQSVYSVCQVTVEEALPEPEPEPDPEYEEEDPSEPELEPEPEPEPEEEIFIQISETELTIEVGESVTLYADTTPLDQPVQWSSTNSEIVSPRGNGVLLGVSRGTAIVTATITVNGKTASASCRVTVTEKSRE